MIKPTWGKWGSWEETQACLGNKIGNSFGADAVEKGSIRRWLEPKEFDCPIHTDNEAAKDAGYSGIVAPATMVMTYAIAPYWKPGDGHQKLEDEAKQINIPVIFDVPAPCTLSFATNMDIEFSEIDMHINDMITCTSFLEDITHKTMRIGEGAILKQRDIYTNQNGDIVAVASLDIFRFVPPEDSEE